MKAFAILGNHPDLSLAELNSALEKPAQFMSENVAFFEYDKDLNALQDKLGSIIKIGTIEERFIKSRDDVLIDKIKELIASTSTEGKIHFGMSVYSLGDKPSLKKWLKRKKAIGLEVKKALRHDGRSARYVDSRNEALSAADILKNRIFHKGAEIILLPAEEKIYVGLTQTVQNIDDWSWRDFQRPARNAKRGMLPPKLARIMVNIAGNVEDKILLDPFCGSGTVLMEAGILGASKMIGSDISQKAIDDTEENLAWLNQSRTLPRWQLHVSAAENLHAVLEEKSVDIIVTEPFLGNPRQGSENFKDVEHAVSDLEKLYTRSFVILEKILKPGGVMVVSFPIHMVGNENIEADLHKVFKNTKMIMDHETDNLVYSRPDQFVARRIIRFTKTDN